MNVLSIRFNEYVYEEKIEDLTIQGDCIEIDS